MLFFSGLANQKLAMAMAEYTENLLFADPLLQLGVPKLLTSLDALGLYASGAHYVSDWVPPRVVPRCAADAVGHFVLRRAMQKATVVVAPVHELDDFGLEELAGKTIITSTVNDARLAHLQGQGRAPGGRRLAGAGRPCADPDLLDAMILAATGKAAGEMLEDDYLEIVTALEACSRACSTRTASSGSTASRS